MDDNGAVCLLVEYGPGDDIPALVAEAKRRLRPEEFCPCVVVCARGSWSARTMKAILKDGPKPSSKLTPVKAYG